MKKLMLTITFMFAAIMMASAEITDAQIQESKDRVEKIREIKSNLENATTGNATVDGFKDKAVETCEEVIQSGEKMAELYEAMNSGRNVLNEFMALSTQLVEEGKKVAELGKQAEPAAKAIKEIKNPKALLSAKKIISGATDASTQTIKEIAFQVQLVKEMVDVLKSR